MNVRLILLQKIAFLVTLKIVSSRLLIIAEKLKIASLLDVHFLITILKYFLLFHIDTVAFVFSF